MRIPNDAIISGEKLTQYLLVPKRRNDKSKLLARAGFIQANPEKLQTAIRVLSDEVDAVEEKTTEYGTSYRVEGELSGVNDRKLSVVLVWFQRLSDHQFYFITLRPGKGVSGEN